MRREDLDQIRYRPHRQVGESLLICITSLVSAQPLIILNSSHATLAHLDLKYHMSRHIVTSEEEPVEDHCDGGLLPAGEA